MPVGLGDGSPARSSVNVVQMEKTTSGPSQAIPLSETIENAHTKSAAVVLGRSNREIGEELFIALNTVERHVSNILSKTGSANRTEAASYANQHGLV